VIDTSAQRTESALGVTCLAVPTRGA